MNQTASRRIIAIRSSRGGCGGGMVAANLGIFFAQIGKRVLLVDLDLDNCGLNAFLGNALPQHTVSDVLHGRVPHLTDAVFETGVTGLYLLAGNTSISGASGIADDQLDTLWNMVLNAEVDVVLLKLPANYHRYTLKYFNLADYAILVTQPLPSYVEAAYRFMTAAWLEVLCDEFRADDAFSAVVADFRTGRPYPLTPRCITARLEEMNHPAAQAAHTLSQRFHPQLIVNQVKLKEDEDLGNAMVSAAARWLGITPVFLGPIGWDDNVWLALRRSRILWVDFVRSRVCKDLEHVVRNIMNLERRDVLTQTAVPPDTHHQNYYELLEIYPGASEEEVRRAFRQIKTWFGLEGMAISGACIEADRQNFQRLAEEAHAQLLDKSQRREYDRRHFPEGFSPLKEVDLKRHRNIAGTVNATHESLPTVTLGETDFVNGAFLGEVRRARNVELIDISNRAKVSVRYLKAIEEDQYDALPARVFTRGFVMEYARFLKVDPQRAVDDFMCGFDDFRKRHV